MGINLPARLAERIDPVRSQELLGLNPWRNLKFQKRGKGKFPGALPGV